MKRLNKIVTVVDIMIVMMTLVRKVSFNIEAVLNGKYMAFSREVKLNQRVLVLHMKVKEEKKDYSLESELIMNSDIGEKFSGSLTAAIVKKMEQIRLS